MVYLIENWIMNIICLDAEFADNEELLELSVFNLEGEEVYHSYYRPEKIETWRTDIHHITPGMVAEEKPFSSKLDEVQRKLDTAFAVTCFAFDNDLRVLSRSGIAVLQDKRVIDVKDMFWYMKGDESGMSPFSVPSLIVCANALGLEFGEVEAHSASADTEATLKCFNLLFQEFCKAENNGEAEEGAIDKFIDKISGKKEKFIEDSARGFVKVIKAGDNYKLKYGRQQESDVRGLVMEVEVSDRYKAEYELRKLLKKKEVPDKHSVYKLSSKQLEDIRNYSNKYDAEESAWCKKIVRNLGRLTL